jgi:hypothetical protein
VEVFKMNRKKLSVFFLVVALILLFVIPASADGPDPSAADTTANETVGAAVVSPLSASGPTGTALYDNSQLVNCAGCGVGGADESVLQSTSLLMSLFGFGHQLAAGNRMADDFTVPAGAGWDVTGFGFYAYQSFAGTTSTITAVNYRIWDGEPGNGGSVIYGDNTTNQMVATGWTNIYRVTETTTGGNTDRAIMWTETSAVLTEGAGFHLAPGTYWVDWQSDGSAASGPWAPPITVSGACVTGNGLQSVTDNGATWAPAIDTGSGCAQGLPFQVFGTGTTVTADPALRGYRVNSSGGVTNACWYFDASGSFISHFGTGSYLVKDLTAGYAKFVAKVGAWHFKGVTRNASGTLVQGSDDHGNTWFGFEDSTCVP